VANSILQAAGSGIQKELDSVKPKSPPRAGDIVVTQGHRLSASYVFHGVLKKWTNGRDDAEAVSNVIAMAMFFCSSVRLLVCSSVAREIC